MHYWKLGELAWLWHLVPNHQQSIECAAIMPGTYKIIMKGERENGKQVLETIFYFNRFTSRRATKTWVVGKHFTKIFSLWWFFQYQMIESESPLYLFIWNYCQSKSSRRSPQTQLANFAASWDLTATLLVETFSSVIWLTKGFNLFYQVRSPSRPKSCEVPGM